MAHAGTQTDLAKQPATSNGFWQLLVGMIAIVALAAAIVYVAGNMASNRGLAPAVDHRYDQIETLRGGATLGAADSSYTQVEDLRGGAFSAANPVKGSRSAAFIAAFEAARQGKGTAPEAGSGKILGHRGAQVTE